MDNNYSQHNDQSYEQQQGSYQQPPYQQPYGYYQAPAYHPGKSFAIAGMILGIVSFFLLTIITGALAIIFGCIARNKGFKTPMATSGIILGCISIGLGLLMILLAALVATSGVLYF